MPWSKRRAHRLAAAAARRFSIVLWLAATVLTIGLSAAITLLAGPPEEKRIAIYSTVANYSLPVMDWNGREYVGLLEILEPLGNVTAKPDHERWKIRFNTVDGEFSNGKTRAKVRGQELDLSSNFLLENGRGLVPLGSLGTLLPRFLGGPVTFHESSRRLFVGNVAVHFTAQINKAGTPVLQMEFSAPVNPTIATEPGKLRMIFTREALVPPGTTKLTFDDQTIPNATYQEADGAAEIAVTGTAPLLASFSNGGRTITIAPVAEPVAGTQPISQVPLPVPTANPAPVPIPRKIVVVIDPSHGGDERGAALTDKLAEKDVTLAIARRLRQVFESRGLATMLLRDGDSTLTLDQRAAMANSAHAAIYISVHATSQGTGVRLFTAILPVGRENHGPFLDWDTAQSSFLVLSQATRSSIATEFQKKQITVRALMVPLRPLNNITSVAVAIEVAPPAEGISELASPAYQELVAENLAAGVVAVRDKLGVGR